MSVISKTVNWAGEHPVIIGVAVFAIGGIILLSMTRRAPVATDGGMNAFYAAQAAQANSGNQLAAVQSQVAGATAIARIGSERDVALAGISSDQSISQSQIASARDTALANIAVTLGLAQNETVQQAQKQAFFNEQYIIGAQMERDRQTFFTRAGQAQIQAQVVPFFLAGGLDANELAAWQSLISGSTGNNLAIN